MPTPTPASTSSGAVSLPASDIMILCVLATVALVIMWLIFWWIAFKRNESVTDIVTGAGFFRVVAVMGVVAATAVLALDGRLESNLTAAILSGIVGYVLGSTARSSGSLRDDDAGAADSPK